VAKPGAAGQGAAATPGAAGAATPGERKPFDPRWRAIKATAKWNHLFNKERVEERFHCLDLQTYVSQVDPLCVHRLSSSRVS